MYEVGDRVRVTQLSTYRDWDIRVGDVFKVTKVDSDGDVYVSTPGSGISNRLLVKSEVEKVEEEVNVKEFKVGDKVKVLVEGSHGSEAEKGRIYTIETVDYADRTIELAELPAFEQWVYMAHVELVSESSYKVGDKVKVLVKDSCGSGAEKGKVYTIKKLDGKSLRLKEIAHLGGWVPSHHVELVTNQTEFTFPEMVQKLIDGEFEVGTELVVTDSDNDESTFYVRKNMYGYGISKETDWFFENKATFPSVLNAKWTVKEEVKEEPIKEMSIEELQKELGYKIKITE